MTITLPIDRDAHSIIADSLAKLATAHRDTVRAVVLRLHTERERGHTGITVTPDEAKHLHACGIVSALPASGMPLIIIDTFLRFGRDARAEADIAALFLDALTEHPSVEYDERLGQRFAELFPTAHTTIDWQAIAAATALRRRVCVLAGGPGTGKTTTVVKILTLLLTREPNLRIALCAPTGKAAARLAESIRSSASAMPADVRDQLPIDATTIHRLLGYDPQHNRFRFHRENPLPIDALLVDEVSMADVLLMRGLCAALPKHARLLCLGDSDQLASVEAGYVLGDVCRAANNHLSAGVAEWCHQLQLKTPSPDAKAQPIAECVVTLRHTYRFANCPGIGALATAIRSGSATAALAVFSAGHSDIHLLNHQHGIGSILAPIAADAVAATTAADPAAALQILSRLRILAATRNGPWGARSLDAHCEHYVSNHGGTPGRGRPILITANDPQLGLANGDIGVTWRDNGEDSAYFLQADGSVRALPPSRLPTHESAWAMTIHKSQGSEYDTVVVVLPPEIGPWLGRELVYTGITRAKSQVYLVTTPAHLEQAVLSSALRRTGLSLLLDQKHAV